MVKNKTIKIKGDEIDIIDQNGEYYVSLTIMVKWHNGNGAFIENWLRNKNILEFISIWEGMNNESFNSVEFDVIRKDSGVNRLTMSVNL